MRYTKENIIEGIEHKLRESFGDDELGNRMYESYRRKMLDYPIEVEQNILEWINNEHISEVDCHGVSIRHVLDRHHLSDDLFPRVLLNFIKFKNGGFRDPFVCVCSLMKI